MAKVYSLSEGSYSVDGSKKFVSFDPLIHKKEDRKASLFVEVQPFLIDFGNELVLIDTGLGYVDDANNLWIHNAIRELGFSEMDVSMVLMSHLHYDHAGGMLKQNSTGYEIAFPNADYFIQREEMNYALTKDSASYHKERLEALLRYSGLQLIEGDGWINEHIYFELTGAHCPYHQVFKMNHEGESFFFGGDVMPDAIQVVRKMIAKYDFDGRKSMELRELFGRKAAMEGWKCLMYHDIKNAIVQFEIKEDMLSIMPNIS